MAQQTAVVEPLDHDILTIVACMVIDAQVFPRPSVQFHRDLIRQGTRILVLRPSKAEQPVGFCATHRVGDALHITALAVAPDYRRRGGGRALLEGALSLARRLRVSRVSLEVASDNAAAIALYESLGFAVLRPMPSYYGPGEDAVGMVLPLSRVRAKR